MEGYLGEFPVTVKKSKQEWAMAYITMYSGFDGSMHKDWVLDQVARILKGTPVNTVEARWDNGKTELRHSTGTPSKKYLEWVKYMKGAWDEENECFEYEYNEGSPP